MFRSNGPKILDEGETTEERCPGGKQIVTLEWSLYGRLMTCSQVKERQRVGRTIGNIDFHICLKSATRIF